MSSLEHKLCAACAECVVNPAVTEPHPLMIRETALCRAGYDACINYYRCLECESTWVMQYDQQGAPLGVIKMPYDPCMKIPACPETLAHRYPAHPPGNDAHLL